MSTAEADCAPRRRRARKRPRSLSEWGLSTLYDGDQRGPWIFDRIDSMADPRELRELWRTIAAVLSSGEPLSWPFDRGDPTLEEAQGAVVCLARLAMGNAEALVWIYGKEDGWRTRYRERMATANDAKEHADRVKGGKALHGGKAADTWREWRNNWILKIATTACKDHPRWNPMILHQKIADAWNRSRATGNTPPEPPGVTGELTARNVKHILEH